jgi:hypothetical protein
MVLDLPKLNVINAFGKFDKKLESRKNLENRELDPRVEDYDMFTQSAEKFLDIYQVAKNVMIARESYQAHVVPIHSRDVITMPREYWENKSLYYLFKDGKSVTDPDEIKKTIKETMDIKLPSLSVGGGTVYPSVQEFVTSVEIDKKRPSLECGEEQPDEKEIADQIQDARRKIHALADEFGFKNTTSLISNIDNLYKIVDAENKRYSSIEKKAKKFDELVARAHRKKYEPPENVGLRLLADAFKGDVRKTRKDYRRGDRKGRDY